MTATSVLGPLGGMRVLEIAGLGPGPFCGMLLADLGADVVRVDRPGGGFGFVPAGLDLLNRGKRSIVADLGEPAGVELTLALAERADVMFEGFRPGVAERLGIGPDVCLRRRPGLVYGRMTGWGQRGPLARTAGHDIDYIALAGPLHAIGPAGGPPQIPLGLVGDFAGGVYLAVGLLAALREAQASGRGQVVDAAIVDSAAHLMTMFHSLLAAGVWRDERGANLGDGAAPFYGVHLTADGEYMAVGALEPAFFREFAARLGLGDADHLNHLDPATWPELRTRISAAFASRTRDEWVEVFAGSDACVAPVLGMREAARHPHLVERETFIDVEGVTQPAPAPRFSRTPGSVRRGPSLPGRDAEEIVRDWLG
ncbi:CaiB/BaiF CoA transferase family protein [Spongiactinospora sp. 9N601]|uniref:CaiB/BaiF CoA transferase family protein n=1 Tax=Spongiactinospora sp. 9N601 TaxID=3375149 RepID=UPI0037935E53